MPGQIVDDSILGDNKEKTKLYWESLMRHDQLERERLYQLNSKRASRTSSTTSPIIHKINAEIQELNRREKELMSRGGTKGQVSLTSTGSQQEEDDDVFSSNGSSLDEFEHSESPRLESGFYSNLGEDEIQLIASTEGLKVVDPETDTKVKTQNVNSANITAVTRAISLQKSARPTVLDFAVEGKDHQETSFTGEDAIHAFSPNTSHVTANDDVPIAFQFQKETPIEKEIRLASEREEEYRQRRLSSLAEPMTPKVPVVEAEKKTLTEPTVGAVKTKVLVVEEKRFDGGLDSTAKGSSVRNIQYQMATERLRKEMVEAQRREDELQKVHRTVSMSSLVSGKEHADEEKVEKSGTSSNEIKNPFSNVTSKAESQLQNGQHKVLVKAEPEHSKVIELQKTVVERPTSLSPVSPSFDTPGIVNGGHAQLRSPSLSKPGFNSIQRYLLKSSVQLRIAKNFQLPPPVTEKPEEKLPEVKVEEVEVEAPRRKLVPATHKIQNELREMQEREKELALIRTRSFKSTPNLVAELSTDGLSIEEEVVPVSKEVFAPKERKRSNLISQWESIIQNGN